MNDTDDIKDLFRSIYMRECEDMSNYYDNNCDDYFDEEEDEE